MKSNFGTLRALMPLNETFSVMDAGNFNYLCGLFDGTYGSPARSYHNYDHLVDMIVRASAYEHQNPYQDAYNELLIAILFHDIVYDFGAKPGVNEKRSADMAKLVGPSQFPKMEEDSAWKRIDGLIMATVHDGKLTDKREKWIADLDLASLSDNYDTFRRHSQNIIEEYCTVFDEKVVMKGRIGFLTSFLARPFIYYNQQTFDEQTARENMTKEIKWLEEQIWNSLP